MANPSWYLARIAEELGMHLQPAIAWQYHRPRFRQRPATGSSWSYALLSGHQNLVGRQLVSAFLLETFGVTLNRAWT